MPTIVRTSSDPYAWEVGHADLDKVANVEKFMPRDYISEDGFGITAACRRYLLPLIQGEDYPPYERGMPRYVRLLNKPVPKKLKTAFKI
jgi:6-phosphofructokinase 1